MKLYCCLCLYVPIKKNGQAKKAVTVMDGHAVCYSHLGYFQTTSVSHYISETRRQNADSVDPS